MTPDDLMPDDLNARWLHHLQEMTLTTYCCDSDGKRSKTEDDGEVLKLQMTIQTKARYVYPIRQPI
jgi:hypothetical protein